jgi:hypothetical protein
MHRFVIALCLAISSTAVFADSIHLKDGYTIHGVIVDEDASSITLLGRSRLRTGNWSHNLHEIPILGRYLITN